MTLMSSLLLIAGGLVVLATLVLSHPRHRVPSRPPITRPEPNPMFHVIESEEELRAAMARAAQFERGVAEVARARADHYEEIIPPAPVADMHSARTRTDNADEHAHTA